MIIRAERINKPSCFGLYGSVFWPAYARLYYAAFGCMPARCGRMKMHPSITRPMIKDATGREKARPP